MKIYKSKHPNIFGQDEFTIFMDKWGQSRVDICHELEYHDVDNCDDILMLDYFWYAPEEKWYPKSSPLYTKTEQAIADYFRTGEVK